VLLDDAVADAKTETCSLPDGLSGVKRIKDAVWVGYAGTVISKLDAQAIARDLSSNGDFPRRARFLNGIHGVVENIQKDLFELMKIPGSRRELGVKFPPDHDIVMLHVEFPKDESLFEDLIDLNRSTLGLLLARKTEQVLDDVVGSLRLFI
jgi:hypothetical protein